MPVTLKTGVMKYRKSDGSYSVMDALMQEPTQDQIDAIESAGEEQIDAVEQKGEEILDSLPQDYTELEADVDGLKSAFDEFEEKGPYAPAIVNTSTEYENDLDGELLSAQLLGPVDHTISLFDTEDIVHPIAKGISGGGSSFAKKEYIYPNTIHLQDGDVQSNAWIGLTVNGNDFTLQLPEPLPAGTKLLFRGYLVGNITGNQPYTNIQVNGSDARNSNYFNAETNRFATYYTSADPITSISFQTKLVGGAVYDDVYITYTCNVDGNELVIPAFDGESYAISLSDINGWEKVCSIPVKNTISTIIDTKKYIDEHAPEDYVKQSEIVDFVKWQELVYVTPEMFGAKGNGDTDDTTSIQQCINYAASHNNVPVKMFSRYKITNTIYITADHIDVFINFINCEINTPAVVIQGSYNTIKITKITTNGDCITVQSTDEIESSANKIFVDYCYSRQSKCIVLTATSYNHLYSNEFHFKYLNAATNCIYHDTYSGAEHRFIGDGCSLRSGSWAIVAGSRTNVYRGFLMEGYTNKGVYCRSGAGGIFDTFRTTEMLDRIGEDTENPEKGLFAKGPGVGNIKLINTGMDYVGIDASECLSFAQTQSEASTADVREKALNKNRINRYCDAGGKMEDGVTTVGTQCFVPRETDMCVWFDKKYVIPHEDFIIDVNQNITIPNCGILRNQQKVIPTVFNVTENCEITLSESYNPIAINHITIIQAATGKTATVYDSRGNEIFDGASLGEGTYTLNCVIVPTPYSEGPSSYTFENMYLGTNDQWILGKIN